LITSDIELKMIADNIGIPKFSVEVSPDRDMKMLKPGETRIVNISTIKGAVGHWCLVSRLMDKPLYFDSFGCCPPDNVRRILGEDEYIGSSHQVQKFDASECGIKCLYVAYGMAKKYDILDILDSMKA